MGDPKRPVVLLAGNGVLGRRVSRRLAEEGHDVLVHHTGARAVPNHARLKGCVAEKTPLPITEFPGGVIAAARDGIIIHFQCMGKPDGEAFSSTFASIAHRIVLLSSCDVYRAYGRFIRTEPGDPLPSPISEESPLRTIFHPYRDHAASETDFLYWYDKIEAEQAVAGPKATILRLPKLYGPEENRDLATVYGFASHAQWRWTHGHVDNVAAAIVLASVHAHAAGETFNLGEESTPTIAERLQHLPPRLDAPSADQGQDFSQDMAFETTKIRRLLGYREEIDEPTAMASLMSE
ncbi:MAG: hypothetical protein AAF511_06425 [Pseudomonadota bacterium]